VQMRSENLSPDALADDWRNGGFGLYIHWPFCESKCPYCDFNSHVVSFVDQAAWLEAYLSEIDRLGALTQGRILTSVFFGGGTPSLMPPETIAAILTRVRRTWASVNDLEITLEANPGSVESGRFRAFSDGGINRISMGVQALNDEDLRRLGRLHSVADARRAFDIARNTFSRVSFDLIYARQSQTLADWRSELTEALSMAVDHLSLYQLTIEPNTAFGDRYARGGLRGLPDDNTSADMYQLTQELCEAHGMPAYEVSNHARPGSESRHNQVYWRYGDYLGIGPGAHMRLTLGSERRAIACWSAPGKWLAKSKHGDTWSENAQLDRSEQAVEFLLMGLRLTDGIDPARFEQINGAPLRHEDVDHLVAIGMVTASPTRIAATAQGRMVLNSVIAALLPP